MQRAVKNIASEIIIIDNNSTDGSISFLKNRFPDVRFIVNEVNAGFAKACNQGLVMARGKYILFLNPDTIVTQEALEQSIATLDNDSTIGALGIKMINGEGQFLKESKRGFPTPLYSLFKLFGFARIFPRSGFFAGYYMGHLPADKNHTIDILAGAYMMMRKSVVEGIGGFDEQFFMYGEDIDLSYRVSKGGYKNYYLADTPIIHFKGESTSRGNLNYIKIFYDAMVIFVNKHYKGTRQKWYIAFLKSGIVIRSIFARAEKIFPKKNINKNKYTGTIGVIGPQDAFKKIKELYTKTDCIHLADTETNVYDDHDLKQYSGTVQTIIFCVGALEYNCIISTILLYGRIFQYRFYAVDKSQEISSKSIIVP